MKKLIDPKMALVKRVQEYADRHCNKVWRTACCELMEAGLEYKKQERNKTAFERWAEDL